MGGGTVLSLGHGLRFVRLRDFLSVLRHRRQRQDVKTGYITGPCCDDGGFGTNPCVYSGSLACLQGVAQTFISSALGTSATWFQLLPFYSCHWRKAVREKLDIDGHPCTDFACHYFCMPCSLCQEHVSLKREIFHAQMMAQQSGGQPAYVGYGHGGRVALQPQPAYYGQQGTGCHGVPRRAR